MTSFKARATRLAFALIIPVTFDASAHENPEGPGLKWDAFGSLGAVYHEREGVEYRRNWEQPHGARAGQLEFGTDSVIGGQVIARLLAQVDLTLQGISRLTSDNSWTPQVTRAFLRLMPDESLGIRLGRVGLESQVDAESRYIGFSYLPIRPAQEIMAVIPTDFLDGGDIKYSHPFPLGVATVKGFYGETHGKNNFDGTESSIGATLSRGFIARFDGEGWLGRIYRGRTTMQSNGAAQLLIDQLNAIPAAQATAAALSLDFRRAHLDFYGLDLQYDDGPIKLQGAYLRVSSRRTEVLLPDSRSYALLAGYRVGKVTPYVQYGRSMSAQVDTPATGLDPLLDGHIAAAVAGARRDQNTTGIGARVDFGTHLAAKFQVDRISARYSHSILDSSQISGRHKRLTLFSATLDFAY